MVNAAETMDLAAENENSGWFLNNSTVAASATPPWARALMESVKRQENTCNAVLHKVDQMQQDLSTIHSKVEVHEERLNGLDEMVFEMQKTIDAQNDKVKTIENQLVQEIDRNSRDTIKITGIVQVGRETMAQTTRKFADFLAAYSSQSADQWLAKIERCHHGNSKPDSPIHCCFDSWKYAEEVRSLFINKGHKIEHDGSNVYQNDHY